MKQEIEIEGLPEGWKAAAYRQPYAGDYYLRSGEVTQTLRDLDDGYLIVQKIQPRRIVLEETDQDKIISTEQVFKFNDNDTRVSIHSKKIWREVKE